jgi:saccharopine dehydrogenase-like NADP-dependent oxidoreductase
VIEEYTRPARFVLNGQPVTRPALSDPELMGFPGIGTLEAWNSDGLRTLADTMTIPNMIEKTLRYPGCIEYLRVLREGGFFSKEPVQVGDQQVRPLDVTAKLLKEQWQLNEGEEDVTVMKIIIEGRENQKPARITYVLEDHFDREQNITSMARTTGYTCTAVVNLVLEGALKSPGIYPPEFVGKDENNFKSIVQYLADRKVRYQIYRD